MKTIELPPARGLCNACIDDPKHRFMHASGQLIGVYCPHHQAGAAMLIHPGHPEWWQILVPISGEEFAAQLQALSAQELPCSLN